MPLENSSAFFEQRLTTLTEVEIRRKNILSKMIFSKVTVVLLLALGGN